MKEEKSRDRREPPYEKSHFHLRDQSILPFVSDRF